MKKAGLFIQEKNGKALDKSTLYMWTQPCGHGGCLGHANSSMTK